MKQRIFIAFSVSPEVINQLGVVQQTLKQLNRDIRVNWVKIDTIHVTVQFLGEIDNIQLEITKKILEVVVQRYSNISFEIDSIDAFPNSTYPKTIIVKLFEHKRISNRLHKELSDELLNKGVPVDLKKWMPHITLGRNKSGQRLRGLNTTDILPLTWSVSTIEIVKSELTSDGPHYTTLNSYKLAE